MVLQNRVLNIFSLTYEEKLSRGDFNIHRRLSEGQEIDRRSKIKKLRTISAVMIEILLSITEIILRGLIDAEVNSISFIN